jgi:hypothetical protein
MEIFLEFLPFVVVAVVFYNVGIHIATFRIMTNMVKNPDGIIDLVNKLKEINESDESGLPADAIEVKTEQVNELVFAYDKVTGEFLAQAQNLHQVMLETAKRYPGKKFWHPDMKQDNQTA